MRNPPGASDLRRQLNFKIDLEPLTALVQGDYERATIMFLAEQRPARTARVICDAVETSTLKFLQEDTVLRRNLVFALAHITHRREGFENAERALFRLALAENENYANNATGVWQSLFLPGLHETHQPFDKRLRVLRTRLQSSERSERKLALSALGLAAGHESIGLGYSQVDLIDGEWPKVTFGEFSDAKHQTWSILLETARDTDAEIAALARSIIVREIRMVAVSLKSLGWHWATEVVERLAAWASAWSEHERSQLRESVDMIYTHDRQLLVESPPMAAAILKLETAVEPRSFHEQLVDAVGRWDYGRDRDPGESHSAYDQRRDLALAKTALSPPMPILSELEWLESAAAVRAVQFIDTAGSLDREEVLLHPLTERAGTASGANLLSSYLVGLSRASGEQRINALLESWRDVSGLGRARLFTVWRLGPSEQRVQMVLDDLRRQRISPDDVACLRLGPWGANANSANLFELITELSAASSHVGHQTALSLIVDRVGVDPNEARRYRDILLSLLDRLTRVDLKGVGPAEWERGAQILSQMGEVGTAAALAVRVLSADSGPDFREDAWKVLEEAASDDPEATWEKVRDCLNDGLGFRVSFEGARRALVSLFPPESVMHWVGQDERRASTIAAMCSAHERPLNALARELIKRFGATSRVSRAIAARAHSTLRMVSGELSKFFETQLENATTWAQDPDPEVAAWGKARADELKEQLERELAVEEFERRRE